MATLLELMAKSKPQATKRQARPRTIECVQSLDTRNPRAEDLRFVDTGATWTAATTGPGLVRSDAAPDAPEGVDPKDLDYMKDRLHAQGYDAFAVVGCKFLDGKFKYEIYSVARRRNPRVGPRSKNRVGLARKPLLPQREFDGVTWRVTTKYWESHLEEVYAQFPEYTVDEAVLLVAALLVNENLLSEASRKLLVAAREEENARDLREEALAESLS